LIAAIVLFTSLRAFAETCPNYEGASPIVLDAEARVRLSYLDGSLPRASRNAKRWFWTWTGGFTALAAGQLALIPLQEGVEQKRTLWVNAGSTGLGAIFLAVAPPRAMGMRRRLDRQLEGVDDLCQRLTLTEQMMTRAAAVEWFGTSWITHAGNILVNVGAGLILGLGWQQWRDAWLTTAVGILVGEMMIWTQPMDLSRTLQRYRTGVWVDGVGSRVSLRLSPMMVPSGAGVGLVGTL
jgi:hypothetical protein